MEIGMEKEKRNSCERSESTGSSSSHSEDEQQDGSREISSQTSEVRSEASDETAKSLTEKLSAALINLNAKEELVKQHAKVAEEAIIGWESAENEASNLKKQLGVAVENNLNLEIRVNHLDGALKECVRQFRQARDEQEKRVSDALLEKKQEWDNTRAEFEKQILQLQAQAEAAKTQKSLFVDPKTPLIVETVAKENAVLKQELLSCRKELETIIFERDLSIQTAETASKLQLEAIKKAGKLEAECRRLQLVGRKTSPSSNPKTMAASSYFYADSLTDSHSDCEERTYPLDEANCTESWASALIAELDQFKNEKLSYKSATARPVEINMMDDFLEMERLAALPDTKSNTASDSPCRESVSTDNNPSRVECDLIVQRMGELEKKLEKVETEKLQVETALVENQSSLAEAKTRLEELEKALVAETEAKELLGSQLAAMEVENRTISVRVHALEAEIQKEQTLSAELTFKCQQLENELQRARKNQESVIQQQKEDSASESKFKQEDLALAAGKLADCQKTIASLGRQLKSLATLEDFLTDTSNIPGFSRSPFISGTSMTSD